ncbi:hypothetical protein [Nonomuraea angiospora]|nr:hypothetical protein [Nonomuraea angiospora]MDX3106609.1 hypothetical protein [Nonomuraea angiospora]
MPSRDHPAVSPPQALGGAMSAEQLEESLDETIAFILRGHAP